MIQRRKFIIDKRFQFHFVIYCLFISLIMAGLFGLVLYFSHNNMALLSKLVQNGEFDSATSLMLWNKKMILITFVVVFFINLMAYFLGGIIFSHKVAGPIYKAKLTIDKLTSGEDVSAIQFRKDDYFKDLEQALNGLISKLSRKA